MQISKASSASLTMMDFNDNPIWGFDDDDGDVVTSVAYPGYLIWANGGEALFILCEYTFGDGTNSPGVVFVRMTDKTPYILAFPKEDGFLFLFPVNSPLAGQVTPAELASHLKKPEGDIFPIKFNTPFVFDDGNKLAGVWKLPTS